MSWVIICNYCRCLWVPHLFILTNWLKFIYFLFSGSIQSSPIPAKFSFEVSLKLEVVIVRLGEDAVFNCKTNDASAAVTFRRIYTDYPSNHPLKPGKITQSGTTFTIHDITVRDGGKYQCVAERKDGKNITRDILMTFDPSKHFISLINLIWNTCILQN